MGLLVQCLSCGAGLTVAEAHALGGRCPSCGVKWSRGLALLSLDALRLRESLPRPPRPQSRPDDLREPVLSELLSAVEELGLQPHVVELAMGYAADVQRLGRLHLVKPPRGLLWRHGEDSAVAFVGLAWSVFWHAYPESMVVLASTLATVMRPRLTTVYSFLSKARRRLAKAFITWGDPRLEDRLLLNTARAGELARRLAMEADGPRAGNLAWSIAVEEGRWLFSESTVKVESLAGASALLASRLMGGSASESSLAAALGISTTSISNTYRGLVDSHRLIIDMEAV